MVDDGSTDNTSEKILLYSKQVKIITQPNSGPEIARNAGIAAAKGEYIVSFDGDDILFPYALEVYALLARKFDHLSLILGRIAYSPDGRSNWDKRTLRCTESLSFF